MHQQIRTSPREPGENIRSVLDALAAAEVNIDGIGPDFEWPHVRTVVAHDEGDEQPLERAWDALKAAGLQPVMVPSVTVAIPNDHSALRGVLEGLSRQGFAIESVLVLGTHVGQGQNALVQVSIGVRRTMGDDWETTSIELANSLVG